MYLSHPNFLRISINNQQISNMANPYNQLMLANLKKASLANGSKDEQSWFSQVQNNEFAMQLLTPTFQAKLQQSGFEKTLMERGLDKVEVEQMLQGLLVYRGNRLVRRL